MPSNLNSILVPAGRLARCTVSILLLLGLASAGRGQETAVDPGGTTTSTRNVAREPGTAANSPPDFKSQTSEFLGIDGLKQRAGSVVYLGLRWYLRTPAAERMSWGGLIACAGLGLVVLLERAVRLRRSRIIPADFTARFLDRLHEGKLDGGKALDYCEMNPSPASRVALAAVRRWGRPAVDLERAVALTHRGEAEKLRRNVGTLRRIAALTPLLGLLGTLLAVGRVLSMIPVTGPGPAARAANPVIVSVSVAWGPALAHALSPLIVGLTIATIALVAYDSLVIRIERFSGALDHLGAETIDAIAMTTQPGTAPVMALSAGSRTSRPDPGHSAINPTAARPAQQFHAQRRTDDLLSRNVSSDHDIGF